MDSTTSRNQFVHYDHNDDSIDDILTKIFNIIKDSKFTFKELLKAMFTSKNIYHGNFINRFYVTKGPSELVNLWEQDTRFKNNSPSLVAAAANIAIKQGQSELKRLTKLPELRHTANDVQIYEVENFTLEFLEQRFKSEGQVLFQILTGFATCNDKKNVSSTVVMICSILLFLTSQKSDYFQMMMGLYLYSAGCSSSIMDILSKVGISVSRITVQEALKGNFF